MHNFEVFSLTMLAIILACDETTKQGWDLAR